MQLLLLLFEFARDCNAYILLPHLPSNPTRLLYVWYVLTLAKRMDNPLIFAVCSNLTWNHWQHSRRNNFPKYVISLLTLVPDQL